MSENLFFPSREQLNFQICEKNNLYNVGNARTWPYDDRGWLVVDRDCPVVRGHGQPLVGVRVVRHGVRG